MKIASLFLSLLVLAAPLRAIAEGDAAPQRDDQPPPIGLDPSRGGGRGRGDRRN